MTTACKIACLRYLIGIGLLTRCGSPTQEAPATTSALKNASSEVAERSYDAKIQKAFGETERAIADNRYQQASIGYECASMGERGRVVFYEDESGLQKITFWHGHDHGGVTKDYYLQDGRLYFAFVTQDQWHFVSGDPQETESTVKEQRIYLDEGQPVKCLRKEFTYVGGEDDNPTNSIPNKTVSCDTTLMNEINQDLLFLERLHAQPASSTGCLYTYDRKGGKAFRAL